MLYFVNIMAGVGCLSRCNFYCEVNEGTFTSVDIWLSRAVAICLSNHAP